MQTRLQAVLARGGMEAITAFGQNCTMFKKRRKTYIKEWRRHRGLTQEQLAERIGLSTAQLSRIESGKQEYRQDLLEHLAEELRTDAASLIMRDPSQPDALYSIYEGLTPVQRAQAVEVIKALSRTGTDG